MGFLALIAAGLSSRCSPSVLQPDAGTSAVGRRCRATVPRSRPGRDGDAVDALRRVPVPDEPTRRPREGPSFPIATVRTGHRIALHAAPGGRVIDPGRGPDRVRLHARSSGSSGCRGPGSGCPRPSCPTGELGLDQGRPPRPRRLPDPLLDRRGRLARRSSSCATGTGCSTASPSRSAPELTDPAGRLLGHRRARRHGPRALVRLLRPRPLRPPAATCRRAGSAATASRSTGRPGSVGGADLARLPARLGPGHDLAVRARPARRAGLHPRLGRRRRRSLGAPLFLGAALAFLAAGFFFGGDFRGLRPRFGFGLARGTGCSRSASRRSVARSSRSGTTSRSPARPKKIRPS